MNDQPPRTTDDRLEEILQYLRKYDARQKRHAIWHNIGAFIRLLPVLITLYFFYYSYYHGAELLDMIIERSSQATVETYTKTMNSGSQSVQSLLEQFTNRAE
jgi:hypothetical protein